MSDFSFGTDSQYANKHDYKTIERGLKFQLLNRAQVHRVEFGSADSPDLESGRAVPGRVAEWSNAPVLADAQLRLVQAYLREQVMP